MFDCCRPLHLSPDPGLTSTTVASAFAAVYYDTDDDGGGVVVHAYVVLRERLRTAFTNRVASDG